jgi:hypothetical protein
MQYNYSISNEKIHKGTLKCLPGVVDGGGATRWETVQNSRLPVATENFWDRMREVRWECHLYFDLEKLASVLPMLYAHFKKIISVHRLNQHSLCLHHFTLRWNTPHSWISMWKQCLELRGSLKIFMMPLKPQ